MSPIIAGIAVFFSVGAFIFYAVAASGYTKDYKVLKGSQWFYSDGTTTDGYDYKFYFGLKGFMLSIPDYDDYRHYYNYDNVDDGSDVDKETFDKCDSPGKSAIGLTVVACIFTFITIFTNAFGIVSEEIKVKAISGVLSIISCVFGMIAVGVFMTNCYNKLNGGGDLSYGNGSILAVTAVVFNWTAFVLAFVNSVAGGYIPLTPINNGKIPLSNRI